MLTGESLFVAGTDTGVGKTHVSLKLIQAMQAAGNQVYGMKPVASGCVATPRGLESEDARLLLQQSSGGLSYDTVNPVRLENPASPNIAATLENQEINLERVKDSFAAIQGLSGYIIVEGIGGWRTPVVSTRGMADMVRMLDLPVLLVVGIRLGCINHAILTSEAINNDGFKLLGWVANCLDPGYAYTQEIIEYLKTVLECPLRLVFPYED